MGIPPAGGKNVNRSFIAAYPTASFVPWQTGTHNELENLIESIIRVHEQGMTPYRRLWRCSKYVTSSEMQVIHFVMVHI